MSVISSAAELWASLCVKAGLEVRLKSGRKGRDYDVEGLLRAALGVPESVRSFDKWLAADSASGNSKVSAELLLIEVLKSQEGFARMMQDILDVLIKADAKQVSHRLSVEFNFDNVPSSLRMTLEQFREIELRIKHVLQKRPTLPGHNLMWRIYEEFSSLIGGRLVSEERPQGFPASPEITPTDCEELNRLLNSVVLLVSGFRDLCRSLGETRWEVFSVAKASNDGVLLEQMVAATDYWDDSVLNGVKRVAELVNSGQLSSKDASDRISKILSEVEWGDNWVEKTIEDLLDILNLPVWRYRHELYSVWVGTRMLAVIEQVVPDVHYHPVDGVLSFEFGGSRLASFNWDNKQFDVWAELRSALVGRSSKRKKGIQPDFRVLQVDISKSVNQQTTYVLECKHYLRSNTSNFTSAAADYARSCPNSIVHIVNHGDINESRLMSSLAPELHSQSQFIGGATPVQEAEMQIISKAIRSALFPTSNVLVPKETTCLIEKRSNIASTVQLVWDHSLEDIDLILRAVDSEGQVVYTVDYRDKGALDEHPFACLDKDEMHGPGQECIEISDWHYSRYELIANNYTKTGLMNKESLYCDIQIGDELTPRRYPVGLGADDYEWKIAEITINKGLPTII
ncbi:hypothetical protein [Marinomonas fungiae]|uniref:Restriction endonuclease n=1 Tax=Marinomonas fungiae TaxID=1137284 RepID=A0A0K6IT31_9GAMM|nr:hypothetical protein [Marinomonas fungiae]CUB06492.1 hypothetical protein Ga0061065_11846 [Marinomonas fungiae]